MLKKDKIFDSNSDAMISISEYINDICDSIQGCQFRFLYGGGSVLPIPIGGGEAKGSGTKVLWGGGNDK